ncbi:MAG: hypothetical protein ACLP05_00870 [Candidatus Kryptoniota bacterium]
MKVLYGAIVRWKHSGLTLLLVSMALTMTQWSCKKSNNIVGTGVPITANISGTVTPQSSTFGIAKAWVVWSYGGAKDSVQTGSDGSYSFTIQIESSDTSTGIDVSLTAYYSGYQTWTGNINVKGSMTVPISLLVNGQIYAIVNGLVQDSVSKYPIAGASVVVSVSGSSSSLVKLLGSAKSQVKSVSSYTIDTTTTLADGSFVLDIDLFALSSLTATMTVNKVGFLPYQIVRTFTANTTTSTTVALKQDTTQTWAYVAGTVTDSHSTLPIRNVSVTLTSASNKDSAKTLNDGTYKFALDLPSTSSSVSGMLLYHLSNYDDTTISFSVNAGTTVNENVALNATPTVVGGDTNTARGVATSFYLESEYPKPNELAVHGVGGTETSLVVWQVLDSLGFPLDINHRYPVSFRITGAAASGAYVLPAVDTTNGSGQVTTTVNSGTVAGTIQLTATLTRENGTVVQSQPVLIVVDGGMPDQAHFSFGVTDLNFAGYDWVGRTDGILAQAGDKYGNPVHKGTAIYFTSEWGGIAIAPGYTNGDGQATSTLLSGNPLPKTSGLDPNYFGDGTGYGYVKASTYGEDSALVSDSALVLFSAAAAPILRNVHVDYH